ncbi:MAG: TonB-dependent receptor [Bacteroidia bacterium]
MHLLFFTHGFSGNPGKFFLLGFLVFALNQSVYSQEFRSQSKRYNEEADTLGIAEGDLHARIICGKVRSAVNNEPLPVAVIREAGTTNAVNSNVDGSFYILLDVSRPVALICSYIGFQTDTQYVNENTRRVNFKLKEVYTTITEVVVSASRKNERKFESPVSIEMLYARDLQYNPSLNMYERMTNMASVDAITTSINFKTLNTRGFNSSYNQRFIQRFDNMDLSMPGFNLSLGVLNGPIDLDVERMELIPGANSALYGPNAISGLMNTISKNPFQYQGLSAELKTGFNQTGQNDNAPQPLYDLNLRYAKVLSKKFAAKVTFGYMQAADWQAKDYRDISNYKYTNNLDNYGYAPGPGNPGYNGINIGGDEVSAVFDTSIKAPVTNQPFLEKGALRVSRTGYREDQIFSYKANMLKSDVGFYFRPKKGTEISWTSRFGMGSSNFQTDNRTQITGYFLQQHKIEIKGNHFAFRSYLSAEDIGEAIDISLTAVNINRAAKPDENWFMQYLFAYSGQYNAMAKAMGYDTLDPGNDAAARKFADGDNSHLYPVLQAFDPASAPLILGKSRYEPGTPAFDSVMNIIKTKAFKDDGGRIKSTSKNWYTEFVYDFSHLTGSFSLITGVNYRLYAPFTSGSVFPDSLHRIYFHEAGGFVQGGKSVFKDRLKLQGSARLDIFQRFEPRISPRLSMVFLMGKKQNQSLRISAQVGYRMPALIDMYSYMDVKGALTFGGFYQDAVNLNLVRTNANGEPMVNMYTQSSVNEFLYTGDSTKLLKPIINDIAPEELQTLEFGWRSFIHEKFETDFNVYFNRFQNLISAQQYVGPINRSDTISPSYVKNQQQTQVYRRAANAPFPVSSYGITSTLNYYRNAKWTYYVNYNYNELITSEQFISSNFAKGFNTPKHKVNIGFRGNRLFKNAGITANMRWVDAYKFAEYDRVGTIQAYSTIDLAFSYTFTQQHLILKMGGTNVTNERYVQALGSPAVGAVYYVSFMFDELIR